MSLTENAKQKFNSILTSNPTSISYTLIGISTAILGYYTFFGNNISEAVPEPAITPAITPASTPPSTPQFGGKHKKNTQKQTRKKIN
jgi:hypothetical protein